MKPPLLNLRFPVPRSHVFGPMIIFGQRKTHSGYRVLRAEISAPGFWILNSNDIFSRGVAAACFLSAPLPFCLFTCLPISLSLPNGQPYLSVYQSHCLFFDLADCKSWDRDDNSDILLDSRLTTRSMQRIFLSMEKPGSNYIERTLVTDLVYFGKENFVYLINS